MMFLAGVLVGAVGAYFVNKYLAKEVKAVEAAVDVPADK